MRARVPVLLAVLASGLAACATDGAAPRPSALLLQPVGSSPWVEDFGDPELRQLLDRADLGSLDVKAALARLERATAEGDRARASRSPVVQIGLAGAVGGDSFSRGRTAATPTLEASYDIDLWGRRRAAIAAASNEALAAAAEVEQARRTVAAETVRTWVALRADQSAVAATHRRLVRAQHQADLIAVRIREGVIDAPAAAAAAEAIAEARANEADLGLDIAGDQRRLAVLLGVADPVAPGPGDLPRFAPAPADVSSDVVDALPEVRAAFARLHAADARRAEAVAATRPQFQLVAALGAPDAAVSTLLDVKALAWALAGALTQTVLDGGARKAEVARASAEADLAELAWRAAVLQGWSDIQGALAEEAKAGSRLEIADRAADRAAEMFEISVRRHDAGVIDGVALTEAEAAQDDARLAVINARKTLLDAVVTRHLAEPNDG